MKHVVRYHEYSKNNFDLEYPYDGEGEERFRGRRKGTIIEAESCKEAFMSFMESLKEEGWELYTWCALIKNGVVITAFSVIDPKEPNHYYGYPINEVITKIASNAQEGWFE